ncbi:MAG TPA: hypothetical protein VKR29_03800, partial [Candidatus Binataceae bacterium]|nr:hypothetical protein [Candidatus Binataceae bacterium]
RGINLFRMPDGGLLSPWDLVGVLRERKDIRQFQIVQETPLQYTLNYAADAPLSTIAQQQITMEFAKVMEVDATVSFARMASIPRAASGKFMVALSHVSKSACKGDS